MQSVHVLAQSVVYTYDMVLGFVDPGVNAN